MQKVFPYSVQSCALKFVAIMLSSARSSILSINLKNKQMEDLMLFPNTFRENVQVRNEKSLIKYLTIQNHALHTN